MRPIGSEGCYARALFPHMDPHKAINRLRRAGGAAKLLSLSLEARAVLLGVPSEDMEMVSLRIEEVPVPEVIPQLRNHKLHAKVRRRKA